MIESHIRPTDNDIGREPDLPAVTIRRYPAGLHRVDLACGQSPRAGFEGVDLCAPECRGANLLRFPRPWANRRVDEVQCAHFVEHIPTIYIARDRRTIDIPRSAEGKDLVFAFFDKRWKMLNLGGVITATVPAMRSNQAFQDRKHRRFLPPETFLHLNWKWREMNTLRHYRVVRDITGTGGQGLPRVERPVPLVESLSAPELQAAGAGTPWNVEGDWQAVLSLGTATGELQ